MYVLQVMINRDQSVVIGCYDSLKAMKDAAQTHLDHNTMFSDGDYFYDFRRVNESAFWSNDQESVWI
jgi:hypothetical protein